MICAGTLTGADKGDPSVVVCLLRARDEFLLFRSRIVGHPEEIRFVAQVAGHFKSHGPSQPCVSFRHFGRREGEPDSEGLIELFRYTFGAVEVFKAI